MLLVNWLFSEVQLAGAEDENGFILASFLILDYKDKVDI